jgi:hypothetical protein
MHAHAHDWALKQKRALKSLFYYNEIGRALKLERERERERQRDRGRQTYRNTDRQRENAQSEH